MVGLEQEHAGDLLFFCEFRLGSLTISSSGHPKLCGFCASRCAQYLAQNPPILGYH